MERVYLLERVMANKNISKFKEQLRTIKGAAVSTGPLEAKLTLSKKARPVAEGYRFVAKIKLIKDSQVSDDQANLVFDIAEKALRKAAELQKWHVLGEAGISTTDIIPKASMARPEWNLPELKQEVYDTFFDGIVDREAHIRLMHDNTEVYVESNGIIRNNTIVYGEPGACKTMMLEAMMKWYNHGEQVERVHRVEASTITKAGLENWILSRVDSGTLPEVLYFEEIEKYDMNFLLSLGPCMDGQGVFSKLNARIGQQSRKVSTMFWMTCNNEKVVENWHRGFIWSRCQTRLESVRPSRDQMEFLILPKKIQKMKDGDPRWAKAVCDFGYDVLGTNDPREVVSFLAGRHRLMDGSYQKDYLHVLKMAKQAKLDHAKKTEVPIDIDEFS